MVYIEMEIVDPPQAMPQEKDKDEGKDKGEGKGSKRAKNSSGTGTEADYQLRQCKTCNKSFHWRRMKHEYVTTFADKDAWERRDTAAEKEDIKTGKQYGNYIYQCVECYARENNMDLATARRDIKQKRTEKGIARCKAFEIAKTHVQEIFRFLVICPRDSPAAASESDLADGGEEASPESGLAPPQVVKVKSEKERKDFIRKQAMLKVASMKTIFLPMAHILALKYQDMEAANKAAKKLVNWLNGKPDDDDETDEGKGCEVEIEFEETLYKERAFAGHEEQRRMVNAADYSDQWFKFDDTAFNVYYCCMSGPELWPCHTLIESMAWDRFKDDPAATGQRWYCKECRARYKTKFGVVVEILANNTALYCKAELPPFDLQDAKSMKIEEDYKQYDTPEKLLEALPRIKPFDRSLFLKPTQHEGHYHFDEFMYSELECLEWSQLYNFRKV